MNQIDFPPELRGTHKFVHWCNRLLRAAKANRHLMGAHTEITETPNGIHRRDSGSGKAKAASRIQRCKITQISSDYLLCVTLNSSGQSTGELLRVARPPKLRGSQTRTLTLEEGPPLGTVDEEIRPSYAINDEIDAGKPDGKTNVPFEGQPLEWIDLNVDGRAWHTIRRKVCVRVGGIDRQMYVEGGPPFG